VNVEPNAKQASRQAREFEDHLIAANGGERSVRVVTMASD
jgi:hypothetical protein